jgi:hypothetical protein
VDVTVIGRVLAGQGARFMHNGKAMTFARPSYSHF